MTSETTPTLETTRLRLRAHRAADLASCATMWADPIVTRFIGGKPATRQQTWARLMAYVGHWSLMGFGYWLIEEKATGSFVGELGFADFKRQIAPPLLLPELGWALSPEFHGKGFATEALTAALAWGDSYFAGDTTCLISPENAASLRVAEKCGFGETHRTTYFGEPSIVLVRKKKGGVSPAPKSN